MKRSPLLRKTRLKTKRSKPRRSARVRNPEYMAWVRTLPCLVEGGDCDGRVHAHHAGKRAAGRKASDDTCIPLCAEHHRMLHAAQGLFTSPGCDRRGWQDAMIRRVQAHYEANRPRTLGEELPNGF